jgi:hypothetical protein
MPLSMRNCPRLCRKMAEESISDHITGKKYRKNNADRKVGQKQTTWDI